MFCQNPTYVGKTVGVPCDNCCSGRRHSHACGKDFLTVGVLIGLASETLPRMWERRVFTIRWRMKEWRHSHACGKDKLPLSCIVGKYPRHSHVCGKDTNETRYFTGFYF